MCLENDVDKEKVRVLKDSGCQRNFILGSFANKHNLRILETDLDLSVHGFNVTKSLTVDLAEVPLTVGGKDVIKALSIPEI